MVIAVNLQEELERFAFWLRYPSRSRRPMGDSTVGSYLYSARRFQKFLAGREPNQETVKDFVRLEDSGNSPRSIGRHIYALRAYFAFIGLDLDLDLGAPAFHKRLPSWLNDEEWTRLLAAAERPLWDQNLPERTRVQGKRLGRSPGSKDKKKRSRRGYLIRWSE